MDTPGKTLIEQSNLENGANLELYNASRTMIGDRMLVALFVRVEIPVESLPDTGGADGLPSSDEIRAVLSDPVTWEYTKQRKFIDKLEKDEVFKILQADFDTNMRPYLVHPEFPARYVKKQLAQGRRSSTSSGR